MTTAISINWLAGFNRKMSKMSFHFPRVFPLISDWSVWHNEKHPQSSQSVGQWALIGRICHSIDQWFSQSVTQTLSVTAEASKFSLYVRNNAGVFQPTNQNHGICFAQIWNRRHCYGRDDDVVTYQWLRVKHSGWLKNHSMVQHEAKHGLLTRGPWGRRV